MNARRIDPSLGAPAAEAVSENDPQRQQVRRLAEEFEAMLMTQMLRDMRRSLLTDEHDGLGSQTMTDTTDVELGRALAESGGLGLTAALLRVIEHQLAPAISAVADAPVDELPAVDLRAPDTPAPAPGTVDPGMRPAEPARDAIAPLAGRVSSAFGWRSDPFTHAPRFHAGVDIAAAYGKDVSAVADGQVVFAGQRGGYGDTVVIQHDDGSQTTYAHLSAHRVEPGDAIDAGQVIGSVGASGRATGPHLHFEVRRNGRPVDPGGD